MNPEELLAILGQMGIPPEQRQAMLQYIMASQQPAMDPFIGASEFDVKDANRWVDYGRDVNTLMADPMTAANAGMAAYGGANEIGFQAFDPIQAAPSPIAGPDRQLLDKYLARPTDDIGGWIADQIANQGATAFEVTGQLQQILNGGPYDDPELEARRTQLASMVPSFTDEMTGQTRWDYSGIETLANKLEEQAVAQPAPGSYQDAQGNWWEQGKVEDSPMTQWYQKQGLPLPTQQYTLSDFTQEGADAQQKADLLTQVYAQQAPMREQMDERVRQAYGKMMQERYMPEILPEQSLFQQAMGPRVIPVQPSPSHAVPPSAYGRGAPEGQPDTRIPASTGDAAMNAELQKVMFGPNAGAPSAATAGAPGSTLDQLMPEYMKSINAQMESMGQPPIENQWTPQEQQQQYRLEPRVRSAEERIRPPDQGEASAAMQNYLDAARARAGMSQGALDAWKAGQQAEGKVFMEYDPTTKRYKRGQDKGVLQGRLNYGVSQAQGRTPLQDALRARAMAAYLMGG